MEGTGMGGPGSAPLLFSHEKKKKGWAGAEWNPEKPEPGPHVFSPASFHTLD
jgi:hypothetical protein